MLTIGLDVGNGSVCYAIKEAEKSLRKNVYPSAFGIFSAHEQLNLGKTRSSSDLRVFELGNRSYVLGYKNVQQAQAIPIQTYDRGDRVERAEFKDLVHLALLDAATTVETAGFVVELNLAFGVPAEDFRKSVVERIQRWFAEPITGSVNGRPVGVVVKNLEVLSQPVAVLVDQYLDDNGNVRDAELEHSKVLVVDAGSGTLDLTEMDGLTIVRQVSLPVGMNDVYRSLLDDLRKVEPKIRCDLFEMETQFRQAEDSPRFIVKSGRHSAELTKERKEVLQAITTQMVGAISSEFPDQAHLDRIILAGGAGRAFASYLRLAIEGIELCADPQLAIAKGLCKYAVSLGVGI